MTQNTTDNEPGEALEPCPFCGITLILLGDYDNEKAWNWYGHPSADDSDCLLAQHRIRTKSDLSTPMTVDRKAWNTRASVAAVEGDAAFAAYNQAIEDALAAIRENSQGGGYWAATFNNAIARKCSPHVYIANKPSDKVTDALCQALETAINTAECASIDPTSGEELPWYKQAHRALELAGRPWIGSRAAASSSLPAEPLVSNAGIQRLLTSLEQPCECTDHDPQICLNGEVDEGSRYCHCECHAPAEPLQPEGEQEKRIEGWITGNQYRERGYYEGGKGESGEPWYITVTGTHWSAFDVQFFPDHEFHGVPHRNDPNLLLCDFVFHNRRCDSTKEWHDKVNAELAAPPVQPTGEQDV